MFIYSVPNLMSSDQHFLEVNYIAIVVHNFPNESDLKSQISLP